MLSTFVFSKKERIGLDHVCSVSGQLLVLPCLTIPSLEEFAYVNTGSSSACNGRLARLCPVWWRSNSEVNCFELLIDCNIDLVASWNRGTHKSSVLMVFSTINHPYWGYPYLWKPPFAIIRTQLSFFLRRPYCQGISKSQSCEVTIGASKLGGFVHASSRFHRIWSCQLQVSL